ncbi:MAG: hypothetical protein L0287_16295 [Anaerolineae bacterium]|nr:hypothetical protein [Anaerolineae bacterium]
MAIAYVVGYAVQEFFSLSQFTTTATCFIPPNIVQRLYHLLERRTWKQPSEFDQDDARTKIDTHGLPRMHDRLERTITLKQIGTTVGPCAILSGIIIFIGAFKESNPHMYFDLTIAIIAFVFGIGLVGLGWIKACQQMLYIAHLNSKLPLPNTQKMKLKDDEKSRAT